VATSGQPTLTHPISDAAAFANSGTAGYFAGGAGGPGSNPYQTTIFKIPFTTNVLAAIGATLSPGLAEHCGMANSGTAGYVVAGQLAGGAKTNAIQKLAFSNDSRSTLSAVLPISVGNGAAFANSGTAGYHAGGTTGSIPFEQSCYKITFSTDTRSNVASTLAYDICANDGVANSGTAGYSIAGSSFNTSFNISGKARQKMPFSNETWENQTYVFDSNTANTGACSNNGIAAYIAQGQNTSTLYKMTFSTDTSSSTLSAKLSANSGQGSAMANSGTL
jgi:hypothetical protein